MTSITDEHITRRAEADLYDGIILKKVRSLTFKEELRGREQSSMFRSIVGEVGRPDCVSGVCVVTERCGAHDTARGDVLGAAASNGSDQCFRCRVRTWGFLWLT